MDKHRPYRLAATQIDTPSEIRYSRQYLLAYKSPFTGETYFKIEQRAGTPDGPPKDVRFLPYGSRDILWRDLYAVFDLSLYARKVYGDREATPPEEIGGYTFLRNPLEYEAFVEAHGSEYPVEPEKYPCFAKAEAEYDGCTHYAYLYLSDVQQMMDKLVAEALTREARNGHD